MSDRRHQSETFLTAAGWGAASRTFLAGDASDRSYDRLTLSGDRAVLMDAPPGRGDDPASFVLIARHLAGLGLSSPRILAQDLTHGFLLLEDLGDALFARVLETAPGCEPDLYKLATDVLVHLQAQPAPTGLPDLSAADWAEAASLAIDCYAFAASGARTESAAFVTALAEAIQTFADGPRVLILRDYHAENLLHLPEREGIAAVGLLDFQLAQMGQPGYDLVSLLQDARRDVSPLVQQQLIRHFADMTGRAHADFHRAYLVLGAQRALRILGIFARLCTVGGKPGYVQLIPRVWRHLQTCLASPDLTDLRHLCDLILPPPTDTVLQRIREQCARPSP